MKDLQKIAGIAALYEAAAYIVGIVGFLFVVDISAVVDPIQKVALLVDNQIFLSILHLVVYVVWGLFMVVLALALNDRLKAGSPAMMQIATVFGIIWASIIIASGMIYNIGIESVAVIFGDNPDQAATVWLAIESIFEGLGGGNEIVGGAWIFLVSWAGLRFGEFSKALNFLGAVIGVAGFISAVPGLAGSGLIFGLGQIVWFVWLAIILLRSSQS